MERARAAKRRDTCIPSVLHVFESNSFASTDAQERCLRRCAIQLHINQPE